MSYERAVEQHKNDRLTYYTQRSNLNQEALESDKLFVNLSLKQITQGISKTFIEIINELVSGEIHSGSQLLISLFRADRMIYIGALLVLIAFAIYITDIVS